MSLSEAIAAHRAGDLAEAERRYRALLANGPDSHALSNLALILRDRGEWAAAEASLRQAIAANPANPAAHYNLGNLLRLQLRQPEAAAAYEQALALRPDHHDAALNLGNVRLALGDDAAGWLHYDQRPERRGAEARKLPFPEWQGEPLAGKRLLVWSEQGFGDQILAARFIPELEAGAITLTCANALARLFGHLPATILPRDAAVAIEPHDYWTMPLSIPRWTPAPEPAPYLRGQARSTGGVGVCWRGNALPDPARSLSAEAAEALLALPGAISLLPEDTGARDFQDTADIIAGLDLVISIDTSVAHLAGAMGKPLWVLLHHGSQDWRWRRERPWHPTARLFRQAAPGDWRSLVDAVVRAAETEGYARRNPSP